MVRLIALLSLLAGGAALADESEAGPSKKEKLLADKQARPAVHREEEPPAEAQRPISLVNVWTREVLPVDPAHRPQEAEIDRFLRCHFTNQATAMDPRLFDVAMKAAAKFKSVVVEVVSGFRSPKYNLMLRKKGHAVARESQHPLGHALDFRLPGLATKRLLSFVRSLHQGGVGYYPHSEFVHADVGPVRFWRGW